MSDERTTFDGFCTTGPAARILNESESNVRKQADAGRLPFFRTATGIRIYRIADVRRLADDKRKAG
jgi:hypothetical protein